MSRSLFPLLLVTAFLHWSSVIWAQEDGPSAAAPEVGETVELAQVPTVVMQKAKSSAQGAYFEKASWVLKNDVREYRISGSLFRQEVDVYVREDGKLIRVDTNNRDD